MDKSAAYRSPVRDLEEGEDEAGHREPETEQLHEEASAKKND